MAEPKAELRACSGPRAKRRKPEMSTGPTYGRRSRRRHVTGATTIVALVVVSLLALGSASAYQAVQHRSGDASAAGSAMSSTHLLSRAHRHGFRASRALRHAAHHSRTLKSGSIFSLLPLAPITGCGTVGTIADASGFEDADGNLAIDKTGCMDWNGFAPVTWTGPVPYQNSTKTTGNFTFFGVSDA